MRIIMKNPEYTLISTESELTQLYQQAKQKGIVALDTEFLRERVYYPQLCLLQIAVADQYFLLDTIEFEKSEMQPFIELLSDKAIIKLLHSCSQDIEVMNHFFGVKLENVFDTQMAAAFCGFDAQVGYAGMVAEVCNVELDKSQTRTDWSKRPLSDKQLDYAVNDVVYLEQLYDHFSALLKENGKESFFKQAVDELIDHVVDGMTVEFAIKRVGGGSLSLPAQHLLSFLVISREQMAQDIDKPRSWMLKDADLYDLAIALPESNSELGEQGSCRFIQRMKSQIFAKVKELKNQDLEALWAPHQSLDPEQKQEVKALSKKLNAIAEENQVARGMIANRKDLEGFIGGKGARFEQGWRYELLGSWYN